MPRNEAVAASHVWPGMRIHDIDMVQPPGISIPGMSVMDAHQAMVIAALPTNNSAATLRSARSAVGCAAMSGLAVLVVALPPDAVLVAALRCTIQPLVHAPESVEATRVGGIRVVDDAAVEHEAAHAGTIAHVGQRVRATPRRHLANDGR